MSEWSAPSPHLGRGGGDRGRLLKPSTARYGAEIAHNTALSALLTHAAQY